MSSHSLVSPSSRSFLFSHKQLPLLTLFFTLTSALSLLVQPVTASGYQGRGSGSFCKSTPGSRLWPSDADWASLNASLAPLVVAPGGAAATAGGGRLLQPTPPGAVCHPGQPSYDAALCKAVVQPGWLDWHFHANNPVSSDWNQWNNDSCLPDPSYPCSGQGYPGFVVNASGAGDVQAAVKFARKHRLRLVIKSSGHDYIGRSSGPSSSLSIWTHQLSPPLIPLVHHAAASFVPQGCPASYEPWNGTSVTAGAGTNMRQLQSFLAPLGVTTTCGGGETVSLGGYVTGGGHGLLSTRFGLGADQVIEAEIVTPDGEVRVVNDCVEPDLFWAIRGGGGSTFGVLTRLTLRTYPSPPMAFLTFAAATVPGDPLAMDMSAQVISQFPALETKGLSGYSYVFRNFSNPLDPTGASGRISGFVGLFALQDVSTAAAIDDAWRPVWAQINETWPGHFIFFSASSWWPSFYSWWNVSYDMTAAGSDMLVPSRLLDTEALSGHGNITSLRDGLAALTGPDADGVATAYLVAGQGVWKWDGQNAVLPAWRRAIAHCTSGVNFQPLNQTAKQEAIADMDTMLDPLRKLAPNMGAYMNEADPYEKDWQHQFWGDHYERLVSIKRKVDPFDILWCTPCVGNERWKVEADGRLCRDG